MPVNMLLSDTYADKFKYENGNVYKGEWKDNGHQCTVRGRKEGMGTFTWAASGDVYVGEWVDKNCTGKGRFTWATT